MTRGSGNRSSGLCLERITMDKFFLVLYIVYVVITAIVMLLQHWYIRNMHKAMNFMIETLHRYGNALVNEDWTEIERIDNDIKNFK